MAYMTIGHHTVYSSPALDHNMVNPGHYYSLWYDSVPFQYWIMTSTDMRDIHRAIANRRAQGLT